MRRLTIVLPRIDPNYPEPARQAIIRRREVDIAGYCGCGAVHLVRPGDDTMVIIVHKEKCAVVARMNAVLREHGFTPNDLKGEAVEIELPDDSGE